MAAIGLSHAWAQVAEAGSTDEFVQLRQDVFDLESQIPEQFTTVGKYLKTLTSMSIASSAANPGGNAKFKAKRNVSIAFKEDGSRIVSPLDVPLAGAGQKKKKQSAGASKGASQCKCGSTSHSRVTWRDCPMNPRNADKDGTDGACPPVTHAVGPRVIKWVAPTASTVAAMQVDGNDSDSSTASTLY